MTDRPDTTAHDEWQTRLYEVSYRYSLGLRELDDTNPWAERPVLEQAINTLATELWDQGFSLTEISQAFEAAAADLPRYTAGQEIRR